MDFSLNEVQTMLTDSIEKFLANDYDFETRQTYAASDLGLRARTAGFDLAFRHGFMRAPPPETIFLHRKLGGTFLLCGHIRARIDKVQERLNPRLQVDGVLGTMFDGRTIHGREVMERLVQAWGDAVFHTVVRRTVKFSDSTVAGEPITSFATASP